ncbi:hypothetical protein QTH89_05900 [Variovorax sp. J22G21]|uniref:hypothetical protein n=1 Tax=Variovorax fucosicus TaxID=3053517 RepID=UPI002578A66D|nr:MULTISPECIES: hypothetical protein [unclassified Variovorax]MDM0041681.1 hypothetical protein [Variovorax sp. J22R193]MDM0060737.1 hypothetical protein [Variovorax sp. J22G21]
MTSRGLSLAGAGRAPYVLGQPLWIWEEEEHVGTVQRVEADDDASRIRLGQFAYADTPAARRVTVRKLAMFEVTTFLVTRFPCITEVWFDLDHRLETQRDGVALASLRSRLLKSMGAEEIKIIPRLGEAGDGHFALEAVWRNSAAAQAALAQALHAAREANGIEQDTPLDWSTRLRNWRRSLRF